ncbi:MAG: dihydrofolate reductase family protein [Acidobacteriota bacterium]|jgi:dihydrofolate reductase
MSLLRVYIAVSVDGYIADADGGVSWLDPYFTEEIDFHAFTATIGATVMGRRTFDQALTFGEWQSSIEHTVVLTHRPIDRPPQGVEAFAGDVEDLAEQLRHETAARGKDIWLMGGGECIRPFHEAGLVDRWELFIIPVLLGAGVPLFPVGEPTGFDLTPTRTETYDNGIVEVWYEPREEEAS